MSYEEKRNYLVQFKNYLIQLKKEQEYIKKNTFVKKLVLKKKED